MDLLIAFLLVNTTSLILWQVYRKTQIPEWVDFGWGIFLWLSYMLQVTAWSSVHLLMTLVLGLWWLRISKHVWHRIRDGHKDERYHALKTHWGDQFERKFLGFYLMQSTGAFLLVLPLRNLSGEITPLFITFLLVLMGLIALEWTADHQLKQFKHRKEGRICQQGLWKYSRHPNYFFELSSWFVMALYLSTMAWGWTLWMSFGLMLFLILKVTGIPPIEKRAQRLKGAEWEQYKASTSMLIPWFKYNSQRYNSK